MNDTAPTKLKQLTEKAGNRYTPLLYYRDVCQVLANITLALGILAFAGFITASLSVGQVWFLVSGLITLVAGIWGYFILQVTANMILAMVDVAVNSHLQVYLLSDKE